MAHDAASQRNHRSYGRSLASIASRLDFNRFLCRAPIKTWISATHGTNSRSYGLLTWSWDDRDCFETAHRSRFARTAGPPVPCRHGATADGRIGCSSRCCGDWRYGRGESDKDLRFVNAKMVRPLSPEPPEGPNLVSWNIGRYPGQEARPVDGDRENIQSFHFL